MADLRELQQERKHFCYYCGTPLSRAGYKPTHPDGRTRDHKTPVSRGGMKHISNIVTCCHVCNRDKGGLTLEEYRAVIAYRRGLLQSNEKYVTFPGEIIRA